MAPSVGAMMTNDLPEASLSTSGAYPIDVLSFLSDCQSRGGHCALVVVTGVEGGSVRTPGALMGVAANGKVIGYVSNGCIDADLIVQAQRAMASGSLCQLRYGQGSPFIDLRLACGGALDLLIVPDPDAKRVQQACRLLAARQPVDLMLGPAGIATSRAARNRQMGDNIFRLMPKPRIRIVGVGAELLAIARVAAAAELDVLVQTPDANAHEAAAAVGLRTDRLTSWTALPALHDDAWTAVVLMFHDHDWEGDILAQALGGPAFYIGALGSTRTHARRIDGLRERGIAETELIRVRGPIGLVSSLRDAPSLAISTLAEIIAELPGAE